LIKKWNKTEESSFIWDKRGFINVSADDYLSFKAAAAAALGIM